MKSTVLIIPAAMQSAANQVAEQMEWGSQNYSVPLLTGSTVTHYGLHTHTSAEFEAWVTGEEPLPEGMAHAQPVIDALIYSFRADLTNRAHFDAVLSEHGLRPMPQDIL